MCNQLQPNLCWLEQQQQQQGPGPAARTLVCVAQASSALLLNCCCTHLLSALPFQAYSCHAPLTTQHTNARHSTTHAAHKEGSCLAPTAVDM